MPLLPYPELDAVIAELASRTAGILGDSYVGTYVEGSFALGAGGESSDVDFFVVLRTPADPDQEIGLRALHREFPARDGFWRKHVEGSYPLLSDLTDPAALGRKWLFIDHGHDELTWDTHGNDAVHRWVLREHGIVIDGPAPASFVASVSAADLRRESRGELPITKAGIDDWCPANLAWCQRYQVMTHCRLLFTIATGTVGSKPAALEWAMATLDPRWRSLLEQVRADRKAYDDDERPRPGSVETSAAFASYAVEFAAGL